MRELSRGTSEARIVKAGEDIQIIHACDDQVGIATVNYQNQYMGLLGDVRIEFGINGAPDNGRITERLCYITAGHETGSYTEPWPVRRQQELRRSEDDGAIVTYPEMKGGNRNPASWRPMECVIIRWQS
jgi:hypothetical protein